MHTLDSSVPTSLTRTKDFNSPNETRSMVTWSSWMNGGIFDTQILLGESGTLLDTTPS